MSPVISLFFITRKTCLFGEKYKSWGFSLCNFLHSSYTSRILSYKYLHRYQYSHISSAYILLVMWKIKFHTHSKKQRNVIGHKIETEGRVVHNLLAVAPQQFTSHVGIWVPLISYYFKPRKNHVVVEWCEADADVKQSVTSWIQALDTDFVYTRILALVPC